MARIYLDGILIADSPIAQADGTDNADLISSLGLLSGGRISARDGNDLINLDLQGLGFSNGTLINGNKGSDTISFLNSYSYATISRSSIEGGAGSDYMYIAGNFVASDQTYIRGGLGNDYIDIGDIRESFVNGNQDNDVITLLSGYLSQNSSIVGGIGADTINIQRSSILRDSVLRGNNDNDTVLISGRIDNSVILGDDGNDKIVFDYHATFDSDNTIFTYGGQGDDTICLEEATYSDQVTVSLYGDQGNDLLKASLENTGSNNFTGGSGADVMIGGGGYNSYYFFTGDVEAGETVEFNGEEDHFTVVTSTEFNTMNDGELLNGLDSIYLYKNQTATFLSAQLTGLTFGVGQDFGGSTTLIVNASTNAGVTINLGNATLEEGIGTSVTGGDGGDTITGTNGIDTINGGGGVDIITGGVGADVLTGGTGNDVFKVNSGIDAITDFGTGGADEVVVTALATAAVTVVAANTVTATSTNAGTLNASTTAGTQLAANALISFANLAGANGVILSAATQSANGLALTGSAQADTITGGAGVDTITGGAGADRLTGGAGADDFVFNSIATNGSDTITDFSVAQADRLNLDLTTVTALSNASAGTAITLNTAAALADEDTAINVASLRNFVAKVADVNTIDSVADVRDALSDGGVLDAVDLTDAGVNTLVLSGANNTAMAFVYGYTGDNVAGYVDAEFKLLATVLTNTTTFLTTSFVY